MTYGQPPPQPPRQGFDPGRSFLHRMIARMGFRIFGCILSVVVGILVLPCVGGLAWLSNSIPLESTGAPSIDQQLANTRPTLGHFDPPRTNIPLEIETRSKLSFEVQTSTQPYGFYTFVARMKNGSTRALDDIKATLVLYDDRGREISREDEVLKPSYVGAPLMPKELALVEGLVDARGREVHRAVLKVTSSTSSKPLKRKGKTRKVEWHFERPEGIEIAMRVLDSDKKKGLTKGKIDHNLLVQIANRGEVSISNLRLQKRLVDGKGKVVALGSWDAVSNKAILRPGDAIVVRIPSYNHPSYKRYEVHVVALNVPRH